MAVAPYRGRSSCENPPSDVLGLRSLEAPQQKTHGSLVLFFTALFSYSDQKAKPRKKIKPEKMGGCS